MLFVEHRAVTPGGTVLQAAVMQDSARWMPAFPPDWAWAGGYSYETRVLPDGNWHPAAVVRQPGRPDIVITSWTF